jgi:hypothetical protein
MSKKRLAALMGGAALFAMGSIGTASADPTYGYAYLELTGFTLTSSGALNGVTAIVTGQDGANYPGSSPAANTVAGNIFTGVNAPQATSGPGPFPPQDTYSQALLVTAGTRGDMAISGAIGGGAHSQTLSEGNLQSGGAASSNAGSATTLQITFATAGGTVNLVFTGQATLDASVFKVGDSANAETSISGKLCNGPTSASCVNITDNNGNGDGGKIIAPAALNANVGSNDPLSPDSYQSGVIPYSFTASGLAAGTYTLTLLDQTQVLLSAVPEPSSLALAGSALLALVYFTQRRRRKQATTA